MKLKQISKISEQYRVVSEYSKWSGRWIHYSRTPFLKINPNPFHMDPAGIYLFPEKFKTMGQWHKYPYKFIVEVPEGLKILDLSKLTKDRAKDLWGRLGIEISDEQMSDFESRESPRYQDYWWERIKERFLTKKATLNKKFRELGYDAIFDDTDSIFTGEVQLIVLNPTKIKVLERQDRKGSGFEIVQEILDIIASYAKKFGQVEIQKPKKGWSGWERSNELLAKLRVENKPYDAENITDRKYANYQIRASQDPEASGKKFKSAQELMRTNLPVDSITVSLEYSNPSLKDDWKTLKYYKFDVREYDPQKVHQLAKETLQKIFG